MCCRKRGHVDVNGRGRGGPDGSRGRDRGEAAAGEPDAAREKELDAARGLEVDEARA